MDPSTDDEVLRRPRDIYAPFSPDEVELLRAYVKAVRELTTYDFFEQVPNEFVVGARGEAAKRPPMREPAAQLTRGTAALFRQLYGHDEEASFLKVMKCLKANVHRCGSVECEAATAALEDVRVGQKEILSQAAGIGIQGDELGTHTARQRVEGWLDVYLHGVWLHGHNSKTRRANTLDSTPIPRFTVYQVMYQLTNLYWIGANITDLVLSEPALIGKEDE